jgi:hypothetical protein
MGGRPMGPSGVSDVLRTPVPTLEFVGALVGVVGAATVRAVVAALGDGRPR